MLEEKGPEALQEELKQKDPEYFAKVDIQNTHRLIRALAVIESAGLPYSQLRQKRKKTRPFIPLPILLIDERNRIYQKINQRVDEMVKLGLKEEARSLYPFRHLNSLQTVGYQEWFDHFEGRLTEEEAIDKIKQHSRNYAKRQWTWFRRTGWPEFRAEESAKIIAYLDTLIKN
jgi:tRNA dimethylallyltransferase